MERGDTRADGYMDLTPAAITEQIARRLRAYVIRYSNEADPFAFIAEMTVRCVECEERFGWKGEFFQGFCFDAPSLSVDGLRLSVPLRSPAEMAIAGPLAGLDPETRSAMRGARVDVKVNGGERDEAVEHEVGERTAAFVAAFSEYMTRGYSLSRAREAANLDIQNEYGGMG